MENKELQQYIQDVVQLQSQIKFFHWQTKIYAKHAALDRLFDAIVGNIDEFTETAMGKYGRISVDGLS
jgi:DNA-binding ferritin-like protein